MYVVITLFISNKKSYVMSGYYYDKTMNKNGTLELHGFELPNQIDYNNLVGPIGLHVIF